MKSFLSRNGWVFNPMFPLLPIAPLAIPFGPYTTISVRAKAFIKGASIRARLCKASRFDIVPLDKGKRVHGKYPGNWPVRSNDETVTNGPILRGQADLIHFRGSCPRPLERTVFSYYCINWLKNSLR